MTLPEGFQWEGFTRVVASRWVDGRVAEALAELEYVGRLSANETVAQVWWERSVDSKTLGSPLRAAWFMTALAIVGDESGLGDARVGYAFNRARYEAALAGVTLRSLAEAFSRVRTVRTDALGELLLRRARALALEPSGQPMADTLTQVLELFAQAVGSASRMPAAPSQQPSPEPIRTAGVPAPLTLVPRSESAPSAIEPYLRGGARSVKTDRVTLTSQNHTASADAWLEPIRASAPSGVDATYDDRMQQVVDRVNQLESAANGESTSRVWSDVARMATELFVDSTKDLMLGAYLAHAMVRLEGVAGLIRGIALLTGLIEEYWDSMHPPASRVKRRANAITWYCEKTCAVVEAMTPRPADRELWRVAGARYRRLATQTRERLGEWTPPMSPLRDAIDRQEVDVGVEPT